MRKIGLILVFFSLIYCSPKGPVTYSSPLVGKTKSDLIKEKGTAQKVKIFGSDEALIYVVREAYFGRIKEIKPETKPKQIVEIEHIYYVNSLGKIYKYQVWKKKIKSIQNKSAEKQ